MKVLLVVLHADSSRGGAEGYTVTLFQQLLKAGHDARVAAATFEPAVPRDRRVPLEFRGLTRRGRYEKFLDALDRHRRGGDDDIVHAMLPVRGCDVYQPQAGLEVVEWADLSIAQRATNARRRAFVSTERALLSADNGPVTVCLSERTRTTAIEHFGRPNKFVTVYHAVDEAHFPALPPRAAHASPLCVFVGQDFRRKGLDIAIPAIAMTPACRLRVVGGDDPAPYRRQIELCKLTNRVTFVGATRDVAKQLEDADFLLFPTRREPFGMVGVEAMLRGVPVVTSSNAGFSEIVRDGIDGRVVDTDKPVRWAAAISQAQPHREAMSAACLARRDELSYSHHLRTLLALYDRIVAARRR